MENVSNCRYMMVFFTINCLMKQYFVMGHSVLCDSQICSLVSSGSHIQYK